MGCVMYIKDSQWARSHEVKGRHDMSFLEVVHPSSTRKPLFTPGAPKAENAIQLDTFVCFQST